VVLRWWVGRVVLWWGVGSVGEVVRPVEVVEQCGSGVVG